ncbi:MAG: DUF885 domain-containing protein [Lachnospiraceae bacterium]|nr:DUF885 domain-containing protein [Lachnospiraceae bacterium]
MFSKMQIRSIGITDTTINKASCKKLFLTLFFCGLLFFAGFFSVFLYRNAPSLWADISYNRLCREIFRQELSGNTLTLHYTLQNPADYGIYEHDARLPVYSSEGRAYANAAVTEWLEELASIDSADLSEENRYSYTLLTRYLTLQQSLSAYSCYEEPLSPGSGMQQTIPVLFSEYRFQKRKDIDDYLTLLSQIDDYLKGLLVYEQEKARTGLFMSKENAAALAESCETFLTEDSINSGTHFLVESFLTRLDEFQNTYPELLNDSDFDAYCQENSRILREDVMPAYQMLAKEMTQLSETAVRKHPVRTSSEPTEKQRYYALLVQKSTGSYRSVAEMQEILYTQFDALRLELLKLRRRQNEAQANVRHTHPLTVEDIFAFLQENMREDFPPLLSGASTGDGLIRRQLPPVSCDIKYISESLSSSSAPAFYLTPQMDCFHKNVIYINPGASLAGPSLFTTLAHEGFPGHLYQTVYARESGIADRKNPLRGILDYPGYAEGWAFYVELLSYDYAANYYPADTELQKTARSFEMCLCALLDLHIHYYGLTLSQTQALLTQLGLSSDAAHDIYSYIEREPANYLKYYMSYLEILSLKQEAMTLWKGDYSDYRFHQFYLDAGPSDFLSLRERLYASQK